MNFLAMWCG